MTVRRARMTIIVSMAVAVAGACSSSKGPTVGPGPTETTTSTTVPTRTRGDALTFREVLGEVPYKGALLSPTATTLPAAGGTSCGDGALVTPRAQQTTSATVVLANRGKSACYLLGPVLLTGHNISAADAVRDPTSSAWIINVHFANDDFVTKVAAPELHKQVAIVLNGVVESAPTINEGITGQDVTISGTFDEATARSVAASIAP